MISNYTRPQTEIFQVLEDTTNPLLDRIHAVVIGPAYVHADLDAGNLNFVDYNQADSLSYTMVKDGSVETKDALYPVDEASVQLQARELRFELFGPVEFAPLQSDPTGAVIEYTANFYDTEDPAAALDFDNGRIPTPGDIYKITTDIQTNPIERRVVGILGKDLAAEAGDVTYAGAQAWTPSVDESVLELVSTNITGVDTADFVIDSFTADEFVYLMRNGRNVTSDYGGLLLNIVIACTNGTGAVAGSTFSATINGVPTSLTAAASGSDTEFTLNLGTGEIVLTLGDYLTWQTGDRFNLNLYHELAVVPTLFDTATDLAGYTYAESIRRSNTSLVVEITAVASETSFSAKIYDTAGLTTPRTVQILSNNTLQSFTVDHDGGEIVFDITPATTARFHVGQRYIIPVTPPRRSTTEFDKVQLNAPIGSGYGSVIEVTAYATYTGEITAQEPVLGATNFTVDSDSVELSADPLTVAIPGYPLASDSVKEAVDGYGKVAVIWRANITAGDNEGIVAIDSPQDILDNFGSYGIGSELGYGLLKALQGAQGKRVYAMNTGGASESAFQSAFAKLEAVRDVYTIAILTENEEIMKMGAAHARAMSLPAVKQFRRCYVGTDSPGQFPVLSVKEDESPYIASIGQGPGGLNNLVQFSDPIDLNSITINRGDLLVVAGDESYAIEEVQSVPLVGGGETITIVLQTSVPVAYPAVAVQVIAADTAENTARYVWERSERLGANAEEDRRISNIWQDRGTLAGKVIPNRFGACEIAGLRTALQPQQGLTRTEVSYIESAPAMYTRFRPALLDQMAARGVWIIAQNSAEGPVYVRHQLTTAVSNGSLYYEDNAGTNVDTICFALDDITDPLIGKRNATPSTVLEIKNKHIALLMSLSQADPASLIGPQILDFFNSEGESGTIDVAIDPNFKDRINEFIGVEIPLPLNNVRIVVSARTIKQDGVFVNTISASLVAA